MATPIPAIQLYLNEKDNVAKAQEFATQYMMPDSVMTTDKLTLAIKDGENKTLSSPDFGRFLLAWFEKNKDLYIIDVVNFAIAYLSDVTAAANIEAAAIGLAPAGPTGVPAPIFVSPMVAVAQINELFSYSIKAALMGPTFTTIKSEYDAVGLPPGLTIDQATGVIEGSITNEALVNSSPLSITLSAENNTGKSTSILLLSLLPPVPKITNPLDSDDIIINVGAATVNIPFQADGLATAQNINWILTPDTTAMPSHPFAGNANSGLPDDSASGKILFNKTTGILSGGVAASVATKYGLGGTGSESFPYTLLVSTNGGVSETINFNLVLKFT